MRVIYKLILLQIAIVFAFACAMPQTKDDVRNDAMKRSKVQTHISKKNFDTVVKTLRTKSENCLNFSTTMTRMQSGPIRPTFTSTFKSTFKVINTDKAELTVQLIPPGIKVQKMPPGGFYYIICDIEHHSANQTKLTLYGTDDAVSDAIKKWSDGKEAGCPPVK